MMQKTETKLSPIEEVIKLFNSHIDTTGAILEDYVADRGMIDELGIADRNFLDVLENMKEDEPEIDAAKLIQQLKDLVDTNAIDQEEVLKVLYLDEVHSFVRGDFDICVKVNNANDRAAIEDFLTTKIYPYYRDQESNLFI